MPKNVEINLSANSSSTLIAPTRSEIRIEFPTVHIPMPARKQVIEKAGRLARRMTHPVALLSTATLSALSLLEIHIPLFTATLAAICLVSCNASFYLIYKEVQKEEESAIE